jgi:alpha-beta hydrolase superfamily lysophospholipase
MIGDRGFVERLITEWRRSRRMRDIVGAGFSNIRGDCRNWSCRSLAGSVYSPFTLNPIWNQEIMFGEIRNSQGEKIDYTYHEGDVDSKNIVVIGHGVTGNKDRPFVVALGEALGAAGVNALRFSFTGNGDSEGRFQDCTISKETADLGAVLDALEGRNVCYAGHSMGGAVGVKRAASDDRIKQLISLAGMVDTAKFAQTEFGEETPDEGCMWEEKSCPLSSAFMNDMAEIGTVVELGAEISVPWLLIHGTEDDVVLIQDSHDIFAKANEPKELCVIEGCSHVFSEAAHAQAMIEKVVAWVKVQLA